MFDSFMVYCVVFLSGNFADVHVVLLLISQKDKAFSYMLSFSCF